MSSSLQWLLSIVEDRSGRWELLAIGTAVHGTFLSLNWQQILALYQLQLYVVQRSTFMARRRDRGHPQLPTVYRRKEVLDIHVSGSRFIRNHPIHRQPMSTTMTTPEARADDTGRTHRPITTVLERCLYRVVSERCGGGILPCRLA
jgi:hypothetical protein